MPLETYRPQMVMVYLWFPPPPGLPLFSSYNPVPDYSELNLIELSKPCCWQVCCLAHTYTRVNRNIKRILLDLVQHLASRSGHPVPLEAQQQNKEVETYSWCYLSWLWDSEVEGLCGWGFSSISVSGRPPLHGSVQSSFNPTALHLSTTDCVALDLPGRLCTSWLWIVKVGWNYSRMKGPEKERTRLQPVYVVNSLQNEAYLRAQLGGHITSFRSVLCRWNFKKWV